MSQVLPVAWYRFRATFARRWGGYLSVVLLIGLVGGIAMASIAGGRRTQSSYPTFLASTNPSDMTVSVYAPNSPSGAVTPLTARIARLPGVKRVRDLVSLDFVPLAPNGTPRLNTLNDLLVLASSDGGFFDQDRPGILQGRQAAPDNPHEIVMTANAARLLGVRLGDVVALGFYTDAQEALPAFGTPRVAPRFRANVKLVGIAVLNNSVVQDDIDGAYGFVLLTPALVREAVTVSPAAGAPAAYALQLDHGGLDAPAVEQENPRSGAAWRNGRVPCDRRVVTEVELAVKPESVALGGFGGIAALVCLVLGAQAVSRQVRWGDDDRRAMRALGAAPSVTAADGLIGILGAVAVGSVVAIGVAVGLSPLSPFAGAIRLPRRWVRF